MRIEYDLNFLCEVLEKCHIRTAILSYEDTADLTVDSYINSVVGSHALSSTTVRSLVGNLEDNTKYRFVNDLRMRYVIMRLPFESDKNLLFIGPYLDEPLSSSEILEIGEKIGLSPAMHKYLRECYLTMPTIRENDRVHTLIDTFCERVWNTPSFAITDIDRKRSFLHSDGVGSRDIHVDFNEMLVNTERMELRYSLENELIDAVTFGQQHKEKLLFSMIDDHMFEKRVQDPIRNAKNYCIIMNTLLRKAAEKGGVHPLYIDRESSLNAVRIERISEINSVKEVMRDMFLSYCRLVRKQSTGQYSTVVKNAVIMIDSDVSAELTLANVAKAQGVTPEYLCTVFKKETGMTLTEYVRKKRMKHAAHLLATSNLQIQTVAMHSGIMDVQYFSRLFKKETGKTPKEYRESVKKHTR